MNWQVGETAVLFGWRSMTVDIDLAADPEPAGLFEAIAKIKDQHSVNVELASPADFIPELPGWRDRCLFIARHGEVDFYHYDPYAQALAKIERGHARDRLDVNEMIDRGLVERIQLLDLFQRIENELIRFPSIDPNHLRAEVRRLCLERGET